MSDHLAERRLGRQWPAAGSDEDAQREAVRVYVQAKMRDPAFHQSVADLDRALREGDDAWLEEHHGKWIGAAELRALLDED